ncbi:sugar ABC transporter substrate-binding protein [Paucibacter sp. AS339]|uniref:ABC transporter substrate-binding protein n=1 Tax=Paucibacter hankyongi TaxID=3133434 RepID=UPI00309635D8
MKPILRSQRAKLGILAVLGLLGAGAWWASAGASPEQTAPAPRVLRFATWDGSESLLIQQRIAAAFEARHPGVKVQVEAYGGGYNQKLSAAFGAGNPPDVMYMWNFPQYQRVLEPLDAYLARDARIDKGDFVPGLWRFSTVWDAEQKQSRIYGVPAGFTAQVIYYNKDMLDRAGLAYPQESWRWEDLRAMAQRLRNPAAKAYGFGLDVNPDPYDFQSYLWSAGGRMLGADGVSVQGHLNSPESKAMFAYLQELLRSDTVATLGVGDGRNQRQMFVSDKVAMLLDGSAFRLELAQDRKRFGVVGLPSFQGRPAQSVLSVSALAMAKRSQQKDLAWDFIQFFSSAEAVRLRGNDLPVLLSVAAEQGLAQDPLVRPFYAMAESMKESPAHLLNPRWMRAQDVVRDAIQEVFLSKQGDSGAILDRAALKAERRLR